MIRTIPDQPPVSRATYAEIAPLLTRVADDLDVLARGTSMSSMSEDASNARAASLFREFRARLLEAVPSMNPEPADPEVLRIGDRVSYVMNCGRGPTVAARLVGIGTEEKDGDPAKAIKSVPWSALSGSALYFDVELEHAQGRRSALAWGHGYQILRPQD